MFWCFFRFFFVNQQSDLRKNNILRLTCLDVFFVFLGTWKANPKSFLLVPEWESGGRMFGTTFIFQLVKDDLEMVQSRFDFH